MSDETVEQAYLKIEELLSYAREDSNNTILVGDGDDIECEQTLPYEHENDENDEKKEREVLSWQIKDPRTWLEKDINKSPRTWFEDNFIMKLPEEEREEVRRKYNNGN